MDKKKVIAELNKAIDLELSGAMWYLATSFNVFGFTRPQIVGFLREQAEESIGHATKIGEKILDIGGTPVLEVSKKKPTGGSVEKILKESLAHEQRAVDHYASMLGLVADDVVMDAFVRDFVVEESEHVAGVEKMLRKM
jgi:bacterioferritin